MIRCPVGHHFSGPIESLALNSADQTPLLLVDLGDLHALLGDFEAAAVLHKEALDLAQELGLRDALAPARKALALAAELQENSAL